MITLEQLKENLSYDPETGHFKWLVQRGNQKAGAIAGRIGWGGYCRIKALGEMHLAHRLAWLYMTGEWPDHEVDHIDRVGSNNKWANLRKATRAQNSANRRTQSNNRLGVKGVIFVRDGRPSPYMAKIQISGSVKCLGYFKTVDEAGAAYRLAAKQHYGEFAA